METAEKGDPHGLSSAQNRDGKHSAARPSVQVQEVGYGGLSGRRSHKVGGLGPSLKALNLIQWSLGPT